MNFMDAVKLALSRYTDFKGRSRRAEYWWFYLFYLIIAVVASVIDGVIGAPILQIIVLLGMIIPMLAAGARRLHDTDRSGWWLLIGLVPVVGAILLIVWFATQGTSGPNRFGPDPLA